MALIVGVLGIFRHELAEFMFTQDVIVLSGKPLKVSKEFVVVADDTRKPMLLQRDRRGFATFREDIDVLELTKMGCRSTDTCAQFKSDKLELHHATIECLSRQIADSQEVTRGVHITAACMTSPLRWSIDYSGTRGGLSQLSSEVLALQSQAAKR